MPAILAERLDLILSSIQRLVREWKQKGIAGLSWRNRSDQGQFRICEDWQTFIVKTYQEGNRGSRSLTLLQVALRVKARAQELGVDPYPSHMTVYRLLNPLIEQHAQPPLKGSIGWNGLRLLVKTREGTEISVEWSNQVWQCDHTKIDVLVVDQLGVLLGRPWMTLVVDTYSRCIMRIYLSFDASSARGSQYHHDLCKHQLSSRHQRR